MDCLEGLGVLLFASIRPPRQIDSRQRIPCFDSRLIWRLSVQHLSSILSASCAARRFGQAVRLLQEPLLQPLTLRRQLDGTWFVFYHASRRGQGDSSFGLKRVALEAKLRILSCSVKSPRGALPPAAMVVVEVRAAIFRGAASLGHWVTC